MAESCENCVEVKKLDFQVKGLDIALQKQKVVVEGVSHKQEARDIEHELMISNINTRLETVVDDIKVFKKEMNDKMECMQKEIPTMFENSINRLLAKILKWFLAGVVMFVLVSILAWNRPQVVSFLTEMLQKAQEVEVSK